MAITPGTAQWTYTELMVIDADREIRPTHVCGTYIRFKEPPELTSEQITVVIRNGDRETRHAASVLAHDRGAREIPIQLIQTASRADGADKLPA
jgi:hypothetical protein